MERKTKQRIIGALVLAGFIIIMLPFFQSSKDIPAEPTVVPAPAFPDQAAQMTEVPPTDNPTNATAQADGNITNDGAKQPDNVATPQVNDLMGISKPGVVKNTKTSDATKLDTNIASTDKIITSEASKNKNQKIKTLSHDENGLVKLPESAWVIQIGSFKNKSNALHMVNELRAHGYKAFIQQVSTSLGKSTRVFVGPEEKHSSARALAARIKNELQINGIVISYKPLAI